MAIATTILLVLIFAGATVLLLWVLRAFLATESALDARLHSPGTPTVTYAVPTGVDAAVVEAALANAGFDSVPDTPGSPTLVIECPAGDRDRVRRIIEDVYAEEYGASGLTLGHAEFVDEAR